MRPYRRCRVPAVVVLAAALTGCAQDAAPSVQPAVSAAEASALLQKVAVLAAERSRTAVDQVCTSLAESCDTMSGAWRAAPASAPVTPPTLLCDVPLPAMHSQAGPRVLVVAGKDAAGRPYVSQILVKRRAGRPVMHEPAYWIGIRYTSLVPGLAWSGASDVPKLRAIQEAAIRHACADPSGFVSAVIGARKWVTRYLTAGGVSTR